MILLEATDLVAGWSGGFQTAPFDRVLGPGLLWLRGPNGTGKSTLLATLAGGRPAVRGWARVRGADVWTQPEARHHVALVPAQPELPGFLTVDEAWQLLAALRGTPTWTGAPYCDALGLPGDLRLAHASAGQRRKAELVAALAGDPEVLLLDETFAHLDADACAVLAGWIDGWRAERAVVLVHHGEPPLSPDADHALAVPSTIR